jgi:hypothetical protein
MNSSCIILGLKITAREMRGGAIIFLHRLN